MSAQKYNRFVETECLLTLGTATSEEEEEAEETKTTVNVGAVELSWDRSHW